MLEIPRPVEAHYAGKAMNSKWQASGQWKFSDRQQRKDFYYSRKLSGAYQNGAAIFIGSFLLTKLLLRRDHRPAAANRTRLRRYQGLGLGIASTLSRTLGPVRSSAFRTAQTEKRFQTRFRDPCSIDGLMRWAINTPDIVNW